MTDQPYWPDLSMLNPLTGWAITHIWWPNGHVGVQITRVMDGVTITSHGRHPSPHAAFMNAKGLAEILEASEELKA